MPEHLLNGIIPCLTRQALRQANGGFPCRINDTSTYTSGAPFGGYKQSGGREESKDELFKFAKSLKVF